MADKLQFDLVSPEARVFSGEVDMVVVPGSEGDFGVLPGHAPFMSTIRTGTIDVHAENVVTRIFVYGGFAEVTPQGLTILAEETAELATLDAADIRNRLEAAHLRAKDAADDHARETAEAEIVKLETMQAAMELAH
ncbi:MAG: F0F1 ATP synthase subunit epsilon [Oceanicaulis sp.]|uniref:F0F1 ATP synthase subunit epsilon n=1 Tax=Glycocaulis sp. TaxID=1969725 RepID=UPI0025C03236|nr:F0F1 ATP synthase subunit epsilon [Glycocaulis sp.]MCC5982379.1 F0F1 ATP synthase subunit epsilon [Oceanicaulis sp.]MCH8521777.1 F0F1 ATP synthase subunit epsilon [Glycocaulis sp.]